MEEFCDSINQLLRCIHYSQYQWSLCVDLKVVTLLSGLQGECIKYCCFPCKWDISERNDHYIKKKNLPVRQSLQPGSKNVKILLLPKRA